MSRKLCVDCNEEEKRPGSTKYCEECWLTRQPMHVQVEAARVRLAAMPVEMRSRVMPKRLWPPGRRFCGGCQSYRRLRDFGKGATQCRPCKSAASHAGKVRKAYDLEPGEYDKLLVRQHGKCAICRQHQNVQRLAVDHDHKTNMVRGLLCLRCNHELLGAARDNVELLRAAVRYLDDPPGPKILGMQ